MACSRFKQDALDKRIYSVDFTAFLGTGVALSAVSWDIPSGLTSSDSSYSSDTATIYISGGSEGEEYECSCTGTTNETITRKFTQTFIIEINDTCE